MTSWPSPRHRWAIYIQRGLFLDRPLVPLNVTSSLTRSGSPNTHMTFLLFLHDDYESLSIFTKVPNIKYTDHNELFYAHQNLPLGLGPAKDYVNVSMLFSST